MTSTAIARPMQMQMGALTDPETLGRLLAASGYFEDAKDAAQAVVKVLAGAELGFGPIASMTGVYIVKGRVTLSANLMAAAIKRHPKYDYRVVELTEQRAEVRFFENGEDVGTSEFTMDDAKRAKLTGDNWQKYPRNMLLWRALSNGAKFYCPDAFSGAPVYTPDELGAEIDPETGELQRIDSVGVVDMKTGEIVESESGGRAADDAPPPMPVAPKGEPVAEGSSESPSPAAPAASDLLYAAPQDPDSQVTQDEVAKLGELLDAYSAPESFRRMALMTYAADDMAGLTRGQAHEIAAKATARFGG